MPGELPGLIVRGAPFTVTVSVRPSKLSTHPAFVPQTISATVCGVQLGGGPDCDPGHPVGTPQSLSTRRRRAPDEIIIALLKVIVIWSPLSSVPLKPASLVSLTESEVGAGPPVVPKIVASTCLE